MRLYILDVLVIVESRQYFLTIDLSMPVCLTHDSTAVDLEVGCGIATFRRIVNISVTA